MNFRPALTRNMKGRSMSQADSNSTTATPGGAPPSKWKVDEYAEHEFKSVEEAYQICQCLVAERDYRHHLASDDKATDAITDQYSEALEALYDWIAHTEAATGLEIAFKLRLVTAKLNEDFDKLVASSAMEQILESAGDDAIRLYRDSAAGDYNG